jgi:hypothetical protein
MTEAEISPNFDTLKNNVIGLRAIWILKHDGFGRIGFRIPESGQL